MAMSVGSLRMRVEIVTITPTPAPRARASNALAVLRELREVEVAVVVDEHHGFGFCAFLSLPLGAGLAAGFASGAVPSPSAAGST